MSDYETRHVDAPFHISKSKNDENLVIVNDKGEVLCTVSVCMVWCRANAEYIIKTLNEASRIKA